MKKRLFKNNLTKKIAEFLNEIGIETVSSAIKDETFLPGIEVRSGKLLVDEAKLLYPGDLLHEAGHLAVVSAALRNELKDEIAVEDAQPDVLEVGAIAWSYAACLHLGLDPRIVFHKDGYRGQSEALLLNFELGIFLGVNELESAGLTNSAQKAAQSGQLAFPQMLKWCRD